MLNPSFFMHAQNISFLAFIELTMKLAIWLWCSILRFLRKKNIQAPLILILARALEYAQFFIFMHSQNINFLALIELTMKLAIWLYSLIFRRKNNQIPCILTLVEVAKARLVECKGWFSKFIVCPNWSPGRSKLCSVFGRNPALLIWPEHNAFAGVRSLVIIRFFSMHLQLLCYRILTPMNVILMFFCPQYLQSLTALLM